MAIVIRYRCQRCGAVWEGNTSASAWVRCASCRGLVDFDWQAFFESDEYRKVIQNAQTTMGEWQKYSALQAEGDALARAGKPEAALASYRAATEQLIRVTAYVFPPEALHPGPYRDALVRFNAWWYLQMAVDPLVSKLQAELLASQRQLDYRDPMPTLEHGVELLRRQSARLGAGDAPPDPDGLDPAQRFRVWAGMYLGGFLQMLSPTQRLEVVKRLHGEGNVSVRGDAPADDTGLYIDWTCPVCGLTSLQARSATEVTCMGCYFRRPLKMADLPLPAVSAKCSNCGAQVDVPAGALQATCTYCHAISTRLGRTGNVERELSAAIQKQFGAANLPEGGVPGLPVTPANRHALVLTGLARTTMYFGAFVSAERLANVARPSFAALGLAESAGMAELRATVQREGGDANAIQTLDGLATYLAANPPRR